MIYYYRDTNNLGRIWKGKVNPDDILHYCYTNGQLDKYGKLIWTLTHSVLPDGCMYCCDAEAIATLIDNVWPNISAAGYDWDYAAAMAHSILSIREGGDRTLDDQTKMDCLT